MRVEASVFLVQSLLWRSLGTYTGNRGCASSRTGVGRRAELPIMDSQSTDQKLNRSKSLLENIRFLWVPACSGREGGGALELLWQEGRREDRLLLAGALEQLWTDLTRAAGCTVRQTSFKNACEIIKTD
jgi:hypothetical protein